MNAPIVISICSLSVSAVALWLSFKKERRATVDKKKALIRVKGYKLGTSWKVRFWNDGAGTARNVRFESEAIEKQEGIYLRYDENMYFPYPIMNSGDGFELNAALGGGRNSVPMIKLIWDDDYRKNREREQVLEFD